MKTQLTLLLALAACGGPTTDATDATATDSAPTGDTAACTWTDPAPKPFTAAVGAFAACVGGLDNDETATGVVSPWTLTVTEVGTGTQPKDCHTVFGSATLQTPNHGWLRGTDKEGRERVVGWTFEEPWLLPQVGDELTVHVDIQEKAYVGTQELEVGALDAKGQVVAWAQRGWHADMLRRTGLTIAPGTEVGAGRDDCARWAYHDLVVDGVTVPWGTTAAAGSLRVVHGGLAVVGDDVGFYECKACKWWYYPESSMGAFRPTP